MATTNFDTYDIQIRENRLNSITAYYGETEKFVYSSRNCALKKCDRCYKQSSSCLATTAMCSLTGIKNLAIVYHAPAGCNAVQNYLLKLLSQKRNDICHFVCTDLNEKDTVFGAISALREIVRKTYRERKPDAIVVASSCTSGIIGEDIEGLVTELSDELPVPVVSAHCEGFKSHIWANGWDIADHAIFGLIKPPKEKRNVVYIRDGSSGALSRPTIAEAISALGVEPIFCYTGASVEQISYMSEALATVSTCHTWGAYIGTFLQEKYGVPYVNTVSPHGVEGFEVWYRELARIIGKQKEAEKFIAEKRSIYIPKIQALKEQLQGKRVLLGMGPGFVFDIARLAKQFGMEVIYELAWHNDEKLDTQTLPPYLENFNEEFDSKLKVGITDFQSHEIINIVNKYKPDLCILRHAGASSYSAKLGIPVFFFEEDKLAVGYEKTWKFGRALADYFTNTAFEKNLQKHTRLPFSKWWLEQDPGKFIEEKKN